MGFQDNHRHSIAQWPQDAGYLYVYIPNRTGNSAANDEQTTQRKTVKGGVSDSNLMQFCQNVVFVHSPGFVNGNKAEQSRQHDSTQSLVIEHRTGGMKGQGAELMKEH